MCAEDNGVTYEMRLMVTFKTIDILWEINKGDKLNLTQCSLEVAAGYDPPPEPKPEPEAEATRGRHTRLPPHVKLMCKLRQSQKSHAQISKFKRLS